MAYLITSDEKYGSYSVGDWDAPFVPAASPIYVLAPDSAGYGASAFAGDIDVYSLGILSSGIYNLDVSSYNWDFSTLSLGTLSSFGIADSSGNILHSSVNEFSDLVFSVSSDTTLHAYVIGGAFSTYEYEISYTRTGNINNTAIFSNSSISGDHKVGETISAFLTYSDLDGISGASPFFSWYSFDGSSYESKGVSLGEYTIESDDIGKNIFYTVTFQDDVGNWETSNYYSTYDIVATSNSAPSGLPKINGTTSKNQTLTITFDDIADADGINSSTNTYQWLRDGNEITNATSTSYKLTGDDVGTKISFRYSYTDDNGTNESLVSAATVTVDNNNNTPVVSSTAISTAKQGDEYRYLFSGTDADTDDILTLSAIELPSWLSFDTSTGILSGIPTSEDIGSNSVILRVTDDNGAFSDEMFNIEVSLTESKVVGQTTNSNGYNNYKTVAVIIDDFSPLSYTNDFSDNLHIYDYADFILYEYEDLYSYDLLLETWYDYGDVDTSDLITTSYFTNVNNYYNETTLSFDTVGPVYDYLGYNHYVDTLYTTSLIAHNPSIGTEARHGDFVLEAFTSSLDKPENVEIILVDIDFTDGYDLGDLLNTTAFYAGEEISELQHIVYQAFEDFYQDDTFYSLAGFNASWGGNDISAAIPVVEEFISADTFVVQAAPNVSQHGINWGSAIPNVINVGAWNVDQDNYILAGQISQLETIDIYANGFVEDVDLGWNFGTSFAAPRVFAELFNFYETNVTPLLQSGEVQITNTDLSSDEETFITDLVVDAISTEVELSVIGDSAKYGPFNLLTSTIDENTLSPVVVPYSADNFGYQLDTYSLYNTNNTPIADTTGDDLVSGTAYADTIGAGIGRDLIDGAAGNDTITLTGNTTHDGKFAHNVSSSSQVATDVRINLSGKVKLETVVDGGADADTVNLSSSGDAFFLHDSFSGFHSSLTLTTDTHTGAQSTQRILNVETINGLDGDDIIDLTSPDYSLAGQVITINGGAGNDVIWGSDATETLIGGDGNDILFGGSGNDTLTGGAGTDTFEFTVSAGSDTITDYSKSDGDILKFYKRGEYEGDKEAIISAGVVTFGSVTIDLGDTSLNSLDALNVEYAII